MAWFSGHANDLASAIAARRQALHRNITELSDREGARNRLRHLTSAVVGPRNGRAPPHASMALKKLKDSPI